MSNTPNTDPATSIASDADTDLYVQVRLHLKAGGASRESLREIAKIGEISSLLQRLNTQTDSIELKQEAGQLLQLFNSNIKGQARINMDSSTDRGAGIADPFEASFNGEFRFSPLQSVTKIFKERWTGANYALQAEELLKLVNDLGDSEIAVIKNSSESIQSIKKLVAGLYSNYSENTESINRISDVFGVTKDEAFSFATSVLKRLLTEREPYSTWDQKVEILCGLFEGDLNDLKNNLKAEIESAFKNYFNSGGQYGTRFYIERVETLKLALGLSDTEILDFIRPNVIKDKITVETIYGFSTHSIIAKALDLIDDKSVIANDNDFRKNGINYYYGNLCLANEFNTDRPYEEIKKSWSLDASAIEVAVIGFTQRCYIKGDVTILAAVERKRSKDFNEAIYEDPKVIRQAKAYAVRLITSVDERSDLTEVKDAIDGLVAKHKLSISEIIAAVSPKIKEKAENCNQGFSSEADKMIDVLTLINNSSREELETWDDIKSGFHNSVVAQIKDIKGEVDYTSTFLKNPPASYAISSESLQADLISSVCESLESGDFEQVRISKGIIKCVTAVTGKENWEQEFEAYQNAYSVYIANKISNIGNDYNINRLLDNLKVPEGVVLDKKKIEEIVVPKIVEEFSNERLTLNRIKALTHFVGDDKWVTRHEGLSAALTVHAIDILENLRKRVGSNYLQMKLNEFPDKIKVDQERVTSIISTKVASLILTNHYGNRVLANKLIDALNLLCGNNEWVDVSEKLQIALRERNKEIGIGLDVEDKLDLLILWGEDELEVLDE